MQSVFLRVLELSDKERGLMEILKAANGDSLRRRFIVEPNDFSAVPGSPFAYWISDAVRACFGLFPAFDTNGTSARKGLSTAGDFRFVRTSWEAPARAHQEGRAKFAKGGAFSRFYADIHLLVEAGSNFNQIVAYTDARYPYLGGKSRSLMHADSAAYFLPGITWTYATTLPFSTRALSEGCVFGHGGPAAILPVAKGLAMLALTNSAVFGSLVALGLGLAAEGRKNYDIGVIQRTPVPDLTPADESALAALARRAWSLKRSLDTRTENSHAFNLPALLRSDPPSGTLAARAAAWAERVRAADTELAAIQAEIDDRCFNLYSISDEDRKAITGCFGAAAPGSAPSPDDASSESGAASASSSTPADEDSDADDGDSAEPGGSADVAALTAELLSWAVGVAFGRFDVRLATGERPLPPEPEPFDPLPVCSPGMLTGDDGLPLAAPGAGYLIGFPPDGVLVDDPGHPRDLLAASRAVFDVVFGADADARWQEAAGLLDPKGHDLRAFLARSFFEQHLKRYSKSRRKAPIYWQLATSSASTSIWLYAHRLTPDTVFHLLHDVVAPKLALEERKYLALAAEHGPDPTASQRKESAAQEAIVEELRAFRDEVARVAPLWKADLDDGVLLTMAPLWRLVPQHRAWQKELKAAWDSLSEGEYDWAHVAMHLWPERVVPKCAKDRSLAIAHGLEEVFWEEDAKGKWVTRPKPLRPIEELVRERTSPAVKAALKDLLEAPVAGGPAKGSGRGRRRKA